MNEGKKFEDNFRKSVPEDVYYIRLNDSSIGFDVENSTQQFALKSPYDCILYKKPIMYCLELKSTKGTAFSFVGKGANIKEHQIKQLRKANKYCFAGLLFNFRKTGNTYFVLIHDFDLFLDETTKKSINESDIKVIGYVIPSKRLKVNYRYDLSVLFK